MHTPHSSLRQQLQEALGSAYTIERELAGGGMSRVFVAEEMRFGRRVVVKVLAPELVVGLSAERFEREIRLAAQLQQANIVPLFGAGEVNAGIPYYTMPFVEGESLRHRLDGRPFHPADAIAILRDVARALEYAHAHGVVHRDIKPENVLLSGGTAVVTDFGIAKALSASKTQAPGGTLTVVGTSLGTPAYMAPEQAVGDEVDARADIYAWGVMAYEMLAGAHPFAGKQTAQQFITAHLAEAPKPLSEIRGDVHPEFAALVMKALEKDPVKRFGSATELLSTLNRVITTGATTPTEIASHPRKSPPSSLSKKAPRIIGVAALLTLILGGIGAFAARQRGSNSSGSDAIAQRVYIAEFQNRANDPVLAGIGSLTKDGISRRLTETNVAELLASDDTSTGRAAALSQAKSAGAGLLLYGSTVRLGDKIEISAELIDPRSGKILRSVGPIGGPASDPTAAVQELRERVLGTVALMLDPATGGAIPKGASQTPTYAAYREFAIGEDLSTKNRFVEAMTNYQNAYRIDSTFTFAGVRAARGFLNSGQCTQADSLGQAILAKGDGVSAYERAILERNFARCRGDWLAAYEAAREMVAIAPESDDATRISGYAAIAVFRVEEGLSILLRGRRLDETHLTILARAYHLLSRHPEERKVADEIEQRFPGTRGALESRIAAYAAQHDSMALRKLAIEVAALPPREGGLSPTNLLDIAATEATRHGMPVEARRIIQARLELMNSTPDSIRRAGYWANRAEAEYMAGNYVAALAAVDRAAANGRINSASTDGVHRRKAFVSGIRGRAYARIGRRAQAEAVMRELLATRYQYLRGANKLAAAQIAVALGRRDDAVRLMREALVEGVNNIDGYPDATSDLVELTGYGPYEELFKPRG